MEEFIASVTKFVNKTVKLTMDKVGKEIDSRFEKAEKELSKSDNRQIIICVKNEGREILSEPVTVSCQRYSFTNIDKERYPLLSQYPEYIECKYDNREFIAFPTMEKEN